MTEIIVISDDDLEEGEICDDIFPEPIVINSDKPKEKKLPRRYVLHENKDLNSKRTKHHKHASRRHKKHHKSCPHRSLDRQQFIKQLDHIKNSFSHSEHIKSSSSHSDHIKSSSSHSDHRKNRSNHTSTNCTVKSAFKNFSSPRREPVVPIKHNSNNLPQKNGASSEQMLPCDKPSIELKEKDENISITDLQKNEHLLPKCTTESSIDEKLNIFPAETNIAELVDLDISSESKENEESEDEEELRRIALSSCLRTATDVKCVPDDHPVASFCNETNVNFTDQNSCNQMADAASKSSDVYLADNYEVVDMELDDDSFTEDVNDNLFVIDKNPLISELHEDLPDNNFNLNYSVGVLSNKINSHSSEIGLDLQCQSNDDLEEELLRAQVIASMNIANQKSRKTPEKQLSPLKNGNQSRVLASVNKIQSSQNVKVARFLPYYKPKSNFLNITRKRVVNKAKLNYSKLISNKKVSIPPQRKINAGPERLVITLNNDSTSEESDEECDKNKSTQENVAVASIEALISDARQKSDIQKTNCNDLNNVSCLSKAQQEEYNALKRILAQKQVLPKRSTTINDKRAFHLKVLTKKISVANDNLNKERKILSENEKELHSKKQEYMASKLKVQHLKEQLHAAELVRASNLESWKKSAAKLDIQKKSVTKHAAIVDLLEKKLNTKPQVRNSILSPIQRSYSLAT